ncbi:hypothetical protein WJX84_011387 [Apatococcus fuscideae]|uniref:Uncharacterized protein n=1 Tax=Apatococcus fuscideae TaxID=2026836 RepID=A0AAW1TKY5_9CHLO
MPCCLTFQIGPLPVALTAWWIIASQLVLALADYKVSKADPKISGGAGAGLEAVGVVSCAVIMSLSTIEVNPVQ